MAAMVQAGGRPGGAVTAVRGSERTIAAVVATSRAGALLILASSLASESWHGTHGIRIGLLAALATLDSLAVIVACLVVGRVARRWAALDVVCLVVLVALSAVPGFLPGQPGLSPIYNFTVLTVVAFGLPDWPLWAALLATGALAAANLAGALRPGSSYPLWNAILDSATYLGVGLVAWVLARLLRASARSVDRHRDEAVVRAGALARERERARLRRDLGSQLLSTVDELAAGDAVADPVTREQIRREAHWLRQVVRSGLPEPDRELLPALRDLVTEKTATGLHIALRLPDAEPPLSTAAIGALVAALREALNNVAKHAGTNEVTVGVRTEERGLVIEVVDAGAGYDPAVTPVGRIGQRRSIRARIEDVGGRVDIESQPGAGTRVLLWVPATWPDTPR
jgi:signal transduction histidine kinase